MDNYELIYELQYKIIDLKNLIIELNLENQYLKSQNEQLKSQLTTERCMKSNK